MKVRIEVEQGEIRINDARLIQQSLGCIVIECDLRAKYAEVGAISGTTLHVCQVDHTLYCEAGVQRPSVIALRGLRGRWILDATISRYTLTIFAYKPNQRAPLIFTAKPT